MTTVDEFEEARPLRQTPEDLVLELEGYEGPIDMLLALAREQKVDLARISILTLADQFLDFINAARALRLEIAADYLVMAAWLAYLKSRLLLPAEESEEDEPTGPELAEALTFQLRRLEAMQKAGADLMALPRLGRDVFPRGAPEGTKVVRTPVYELSLFDLLKAYGDNRRRVEWSSLEIEPSELFAMSDFLERLSGSLADMKDWESLFDVIPDNVEDGLVRRSAVAAAFAASLELAREGKMMVRQSSPFGPIFVRQRPDA